jgi:hypothetical protein
MKLVYRCPGPNFVWHIDGYMKPEPFGIEIYAAIDGYSRYIAWIYVGISTRTGISVLHQYMKTISTIGFLPRALRSDLGSETNLIGDAHKTSQKCTFGYSVASMKAKRSHHGRWSI